MKLILVDMTIQGLLFFGIVIFCLFVSLRYQSLAAALYTLPIFVLLFLWQFLSSLILGIILKSGWRISFLIGFALLILPFYFIHVSNILGTIAFYSSVIFSLIYMVLTGREAFK